VCSSDLLFISNKANKPTQSQVASNVGMVPEVPQQVAKALNIQKEEPTSKPQESESSQRVGQEQPRILPSLDKNAVEAGISPNVHRLVIEATDETWVKVWIDNQETSLSRLMTDGERIEFEVKEQAKVRLGNAAGARIIWDDKVLEKLGRKGRVITISLPQNQKSSKKNVR
jgi:hypothetical protein